MTTDLSICGPAIEAECQHWEKTKTFLNTAHAATRALQLNVANAGIFQLIIEPNNKVCTLLGQELERGTSEVDNIINALKRSLTAYRNNEAQTSEIIANTFS
jgi:hypothetical protein